MLACLRRVTPGTINAIAAEHGLGRATNLNQALRKKAMMHNKVCSLVALMCAVLAVGCAHGQLPPTQHTVLLNWGATTSGGTAPYKYVMSRYTLVAADKGACPTVNTTTPNYTPLNSSAPVSVLNYTDSSASGLTACYTVQAVDSATPAATGGPSNVAGPFTVPTVPGAPVTLGGALTSSLDMKQPPLAPPATGADAPVLMGKLTGKVQ